MKVPRRVDGSVCGAVLSKPSSTGSKLPAATGRCFSASRDVAHRPLRSRPGESFSCDRSSLWILSTFLPTVNARRPDRTSHAQDAYTRLDYSTASAAAVASKASVGMPAPKAILNQDRSQLLSMIDAAGEGTVQEHLDYYKDPYRRGYAQPDGPKLRVSESKKDVAYPTKDLVPTPDDALQQLIARLCMTIGQRIRHPGRFALDPVYKLYMQLPQPRMLLLTGHWRHRLMKVMGLPPKRDMESMLRYFALVADVKNAGLTLRRTHWNFALAFATKYVSQISQRELQSVLLLWREMEKESKVSGDDVTFNILFDAAAKAGNFTLAEMIYHEMESRGIEFSRYHHVSLIYYFGLRLDSGGIRAAYKEMVNAGEMVDTVALNCVISGLLRCGEEDSAEQTYEKMKSRHALAVDMPERDYTMNKITSRVLMMFAKVGKQHPQLKKSFQQNVQLTPDLRTYKLFAEHYAIKVGNLKKVAQFLDEMKHLRIPLHPTIFLALFKGFFTHGGPAGSDWSRQRLEGVLSALYQAFDEHGKNFRIDRWVVIWALRAVKVCADNTAVMATFEALSQRWDIPEDRHSFLESILDNIINERDMKSPHGQWGGLAHRKQKKDGSRL
ncbi:hypothetical protein S40288_03937 [Stachybotrys chartarum IBT 40288]|nr:hypothetical protein S40288_03937 [Stachybotrys chartarum IBT 40288]